MVQADPAWHSWDRSLSPKKLGFKMRWGFFGQKSTVGSASPKLLWWGEIPVFLFWDGNGQGREALWDGGTTHGSREEETLGRV